MGRETVLLSPFSSQSGSISDIYDGYQAMEGPDGFHHWGTAGGSNIQCYLDNRCIPNRMGCNRVEPSSKKCVVMETVMSPHIYAGTAVFLALKYFRSHLKKRTVMS